ncbi:MAG: hypothetical protein AAGN66_09175, partial [Acidobacteriota bacterium]
MTDALRSVGRFTWSMSVFGASQAAQMVAGLGRTGAGAELAGGPAHRAGGPGPPRAPPREGVKPPPPPPPPR